ncbi:hypothetical protein HYH03_011359 [Edaphochlamys debaryana]|uniref:ribose-5-phosphate isomerase n=1 Tax=Edaphochlamys debaryana TaxID=47281 RepID=A0A835Y0E0_9CHLO|nr:hypothetical protein HYH03_011359 [Edaphochlamys debaryana]|eukprot:KAG2490235.1 hypothetical protein HYH03_011359 [Edaphochlamys debaryana]
MRSATMNRASVRSHAHCAGMHRASRRAVAVFCSRPAVAESKRAAAKAVVDRFVTNNSVIGLGPGELCNLVIEEVGTRLAMGKLEGVSGFPACDVAAHEAAFHGLPLLPEARATEVTLVLAEADALDPGANAALLGCSGEPQQPDIPRLRSLLSKQGGAPLVLLTESSRVVKRLGGTLPVWLDADNWEESAEELDDIFLGDAELWRRSATGQQDNPRGGDNPYVSPQGHAIVDVRFYEGLKLFGEDEQYGKIADEIDNVVGVAAHGLVLGRAAAAVVVDGADPKAAPQVIEF